MVQIGDAYSKKTRHITSTISSCEQIVGNKVALRAL